MKRVSVVLVLAAAPLIAAPLAECPDCGGAVSPRAVMCPHCGAPGEAIAEAVASRAAEEAEEETKEPDGVLVAKVNGRECYALPVAMKDGAFAVLPADALAGLETLELFFASTNLPVAYGTPSVAQGAPLVRFPLSETNLAFRAIAAKADEGFVFDPATLPPDAPAPVAAVRARAKQPPSERGVAQSAGGSIPSGDLAAVPLSPALLWRDVPPRELKAMFQPKKQETP